MRNSLPYLAILLLLLGLAFFAWLTAHPADPMVDRAMQWPGIGFAARWFRATYPIAPPPTVAGPDSVVGEPGPRGVHREIWLEPGTLLHEQPGELSETTGEIRNVTNALILERQGPWYLVSSARQGRGWAHLPDYRDSDRPIFGSGLIPVGPLPPRPANPERLALARDLLGESRSVRMLGPYLLLTDIQNPLLWERCEGLIEQSEELYAVRYGLVPIEEPREAIVAFSREAAYQRFLASERASGSSGHTRAGLIALHQEHRLREEILATLAHEIAHLLNRRALGPALPLWLDEGIAEDFAGQLSHPMAIEAPDGWWASGPGAAPLLVREARSRGDAPTLATLTASEGDAVFLDPRSRNLHYSAAGLWIRFLVESGAEGGFESYLQGVASGGPFGLEALEAAMEADASQLDAVFWEWFDELGEEPQEPTAPSGSSSRQRDVPSG